MFLKYGKLDALAIAVQDNAYSSCHMFRLTTTHMNKLGECSILKSLKIVTTAIILILLDTKVPATLFARL
jgi:hypothetical protein